MLRVRGRCKMHDAFNATQCLGPVRVAVDFADTNSGFGAAYAARNDPANGRSRRTTRFRERAAHHRADEAIRAAHQYGPASVHLNCPEKRES